MQQTDLSDYLNPYPETPGHRGVATSIEAAQAIAPGAENLRGAILAALKYVFAPTGATAHALADFLSKPYANVQPRCAELAQMGKIKPGPRRGKTPTGKSCIMWEAV